MKDEIVIYQANEIPTRLEVKIENETVWLNMEQISLLFGRDRTVINRHINNIFKEGELIKKEVCAIFAHTTQRFSAIRRQGILPQNFLRRTELQIYHFPVLRSTNPLLAYR